MNKQELIEKFEQFSGHGSRCYIERNEVLDLVKQLDEPKPVKVPQCVADVIEGAREQSPELEDALHYTWGNGTKEFTEWYNKKSNRDLFARAWLDGYEVEKESKYIVKVKATGQCLGKYYINNEILSPRFTYTGRHADSFTRKELEEADFSWVFDCDGVGVEEVE